MRVFQTSAFLLVVVVIAALARKSDDEEWLAYKMKYGKKHVTPEEDSRRKYNFLRTHRTIEEHNSKGGSYQMTHNHFSDWDQEEKTKILGAKLENGYYGKRSALRNIERIIDASKMRELPLSLDYRTHPCLSAIKYQEQCGSCWAFTATAPLEFATCNKTATKQPVSLSEQQLVDCVQSGCNGGWFTTAWSYLKANGVISTEDYPYQAVMGTTCPAVNASITKPVSWGSVAGSASDIMSALVNYGPLAAALDVKDDFMNYGSGIYSSTVCSQTSINHGVVIVGYGSSDESDYWIVRNSWGTWWGIQGYVLIKKGDNMCSIENHVNFVTV